MPEPPATHGRLAHEEMERHAHLMLTADRQLLNSGRYEALFSSLSKRCLRFGLLKLVALCAYAVDAALRFVEYGASGEPNRLIVGAAILVPVLWIAIVSTRRQTALRESMRHARNLLAANHGMDERGRRAAPRPTTARSA